MCITAKVPISSLCLKVGKFEIFSTIFLTACLLVMEPSSLDLTSNITRDPLCCTMQKPLYTTLEQKWETEFPQMESHHLNAVHKLNITQRFKFENDYICTQFKVTTFKPVELRRQPYCIFLGEKSSVEWKITNCTASVVQHRLFIFGRADVLNILQETNQTKCLFIID